MALWGNKDLANNAPQYRVAGGYGVSANGQALYQNTLINAFVTGEALGVFGSNVNETNSSTAPFDETYVPHAGWNLRIAGTGPLTGISIVSPGRGYNVGGGAANGYIQFTGAYGSGANAQWFSNANGSITSVTVHNYGANYNVAPTATIANTNTAMATFAVSVGGRAGRVTFETLVAMGSLDNPT